MRMNLNKFTVHLISLADSKGIVTKDTLFIQNSIDLESPTGQLRCPLTVMVLYGAVLDSY